MAIIEKKSIHRISSVDYLKDFNCGVPPMDNFIHGMLQLSIDHYYCRTYVAEINDEIVAVFALSFDSVDLDSDDREELSMGVSSAGTPDVSGEYEEIFYSKRRYPALDIAYLAVNEKYKGSGIGSSIIEQIVKMAKEQEFAGCQFISVEALKTEPYNAVGFYYKCGFTANELPKPTKDTLRMIKTLRTK